MTQDEVKTLLDSVGVPTAYYEFPDDTVTAPPFICFYYGQSDDLYADDSNYARISRLYVELYTDAKDFELESKLETILSQAGITYTKDDQEITSERMHETLYTMEVTNNG